MSNKPSEKRVLIYTLLFSIALMVIKFAAFSLTGSNAIFSDALESIINVAAGGFALWSLVLSIIPRDSNHPYGHGKVEFISSGAEGTMIIIAGISIIVKSVSGFLEPKEISSLDIGLLLIILSGVLNYVVGFGLMKRGEKTHTLILESNGRHLMTDAYSTAGIIVGLFIIYFTDILWLDDVIAIIAGIGIIVTGAKIIRKSLAGVLDEADFSVINELLVQINKERKQEWIDIHNFRTIKYGRTIHIDCHVTLPWYWSINEGHKEIKDLSTMMNERLPRKPEFFIHVDPCDESQCSSCSLECAHRKHTFKSLVKWTPESIIKDKKQINH